MTGLLPGSRSAAVFLPLMALLMMATACTEPEQPGGFAGLGGTGPERAFHQPGPGDGIRLPEDWGEHPDHRIEWWYLTANLETAGGEPLGLQWTQFRQGLEPRPPEQEPPAASGWPLQSAWMAHGAVSFQGQHWFSERFARGDIGQAGARAEPLKVWLDHWQLEEQPSGRWHLTASGEDWAYQLELVPGDDVVRHGDDGFSAKTAEGQGSMYFSLTDIAIRGTVILAGEAHSVNGAGWLDREWSSQFLRADQRGWDWFALRLDNGARLMAFRVGEGDGAFVSGTWVEPGGQAVPLGAQDLRLTIMGHRDTGRGRIPDWWQLEILSLDTTLTVRAVEGSYWNEGFYPYWESPVEVSGDASGEGYMELTGYGDR